MQQLLIPSLTMAASALIAGVAILSESELGKNTVLNQIRIVVPAILLIGITSYMLYRSRLKRSAAILILISTPFFVLVANWLPIFMLTDYRSHWRPVIFTLSAIYVSFYLFTSCYGAVREQHD